MLVQAFAALDNPAAHLLLVGDGLLRTQLTTYIQEHGLQHRVHLLGRRDDVRECLAASDVFVLSSSWEGSPLSVMEAMAASLPVVATAVGGVPELVESGRHGILVPPVECAALTGAMRTLLDNPGLRADMGKAGRSRANAEFSVERMVQGYANLYRAHLGLACRETSAACAS
jgi:glycosyltransferase involved in cell wall biosynthesis